MNVNREACPFFSALASETRLKIIELLGEREMNIRDLAQMLGLSSTIVAKHVKILESAQIIRCRTIPGERGLQKLCRLIQDGMVLNFAHKNTFPQAMCFDIPIGSYVDWSVRPTCGIADSEEVFDFQDDARVFADPRRMNAGCIWVGHGYLEYAVPNYVSLGKRLSEIRIQLEICSEAPGYDMNWPSDIYFEINGLSLGFWTCPGDFGDKKGIYSPDWYTKSFNSQYGELKQIVVNGSGSFIDGNLSSAVTVEDIWQRTDKDFRFRISSPESAVNPRGFNLFGKRFGNYDQNILFTVVSTPEL